jgi:hypothetical protein
MEPLHTQHRLTTNQANTTQMNPHIDMTPMDTKDPQMKITNKNKEGRHANKQDKTEPTLKDNQAEPPTP